ncbi:MAG: 30S ribosomal protein S16 [Candidatus Saccharimonadales bacterium]
MLVIRMQRTGRKGHAQFRIVVQDSRRTPTSGKVVAALGSYDPHAKTTTLDKEKAALYVSNGAQPTPRAARLMKAEGVKLPEWVKLAESKAGKLRHPEKLRRNQPKEAAAPKVEAPVAEETPVEEPTVEAPAEVETAAEAPAEETTEA